ncbi:MAG: alkaline phosphatase D family protein, partial [Actinomycetota bacterium]
MEGRCEGVTSHRLLGDLAVPHGAARTSPLTGRRVAGQVFKSSRRNFLKGAFFGVMGAILRWMPAGAQPSALTLERVDQLPTGITRTWIGAPYWANRLRDWRLIQGRIECLSTNAADGGRTVAVLTREIVAGDRPGAVSVQTGTLAMGAGGYSGILVGAGGGSLDHRAAALVQRCSGTGGGLLCTYESDGSVAFRNHTDESNQLAHERLTPATSTGPGAPRTTSENILLRLDIVPQGSGIYELILSAADATTGGPLASATMPNVPAASIRGGISLMSSPLKGTDGARYWFKNLSTGGPKVATRPTRALGPILGTLYSLNGGTLKLTAQFMPIGDSQPHRAQLQHRLPGGPWKLGPIADIGEGYTALFRIDDWDSMSEREYRVAWPPTGTYRQFFYGRIRRDPTQTTGPAIGMINCTIHTFRPLDRISSGAPKLPGESHLGLYTPDSLYFPYAQLVSNLERQDPDLLVAFGDQFYQAKPTREDGSPWPTLDFLYKYFLWLWSFRDLTRNRPTIVMVDDHDLFQGNVWGHAGAPAPNRSENLGGYVNAPVWVNLMQRVQCGHNPDPFDPTPVKQDISVYYGSFQYGGVSFAILEDRKFKTGDANGLDPSGEPYPESLLELLGTRQELFLSTWRTQHPGSPKIVLTQSLFGALQTDRFGQAVHDFDSNGYPHNGRKEAVGRIKSAGALILSGDQHLSSLVRHGLTSFTDGPIQFTAPAAGTAHQRWFEPIPPPPNGSGTPHTGDFVDAFGNRMSV